MVRIGSALSDPLPLTTGVAQGSTLGPVLFMCMLRLLSVPKKCEAMGYVDDIKLLLALPPTDLKVAIHDLNSDLHAVAKWCSNSLLINPDKTTYCWGSTINAKLIFTSCRSNGEKHQALCCRKRLGGLGRHRRNI